MKVSTKEKLQGIFAPIVTPFKDNEDIDLDALRHNLAMYARTNLGGFLTLGSNGENKSLSESEKLTVVETVLAGKHAEQTVVVGVMYEAQRHAERFIAAVADLGADFALVQSPSYFKKLITDDLLLGYFSALADLAAIPLLIYNCPQFNGIMLSIELLRQLSKHPNIVGMKDSTPGCDLEVMQLNSDSFHVMVGSITKLNDFVSSGAIGGTVSFANYCPDLAAELYRRIRDEGPAKAADLNRRLVESNKRIAGPFGVPGVKAAMNLTGYAAGIPRRPLCPLTAADVDTIKSILVELKVLDK